MTLTIESILPTAKDCLRKSAEMEAEKAAKHAREAAVADAEKRALLDRLLKPSAVSDEERMARAAAIINRAVSNGQIQVEVGRFSNKLFTDEGRAINQQEPGWETTLTGLPKELYEFWKRYLRPRGYRLKLQIVEWPGGIPGDIGMTLMWG